jgi:MFS transporter, SP family, general alpha glucoside:H+ symporter
MSNPVDSKPHHGGDAAGVEAIAHIDHSADLDEKAKLSAYKGDAIEAENAELNMGVLEAVKLYPMATFWAFVMSTTIVSGPLDAFVSPPPHPLPFQGILFS